jgi:hypothetical protein
LHLLDWQLILLDQHLLQRPEFELLDVPQLAGAVEEIPCIPVNGRAKIRVEASATSVSRRHPMRWPVPPCFEITRHCRNLPDVDISST